MALQGLTQVFVRSLVFLISLGGSIGPVFATHPLERDFKKFTTELSQNLAHCEPMMSIGEPSADGNMVDVKLIAGALSLQLDLSSIQASPSMTKNQTVFLDLVKTGGGTLSDSEKTILLKRLNRCSIDPSEYTTATVRSLVGLIYEIHRDAVLKLSYEDSEITYADLLIWLSNTTFCGHI